MPISPNSTGGAIRRPNGEYLSTLWPVLRLVWLAGRLLSVGALMVSVASGLLPTANVLIVSALIGTLGRFAASFPRGRVPGLAHHLLILIALLAGTALAAQFAQRLGQTVVLLQGSQVSRRAQVLLATKAASVDLGSCEDKTFQNNMATVANEALHRPHQMVTQLSAIVSTLMTVVSLGGVLVLWHVWAVAALVLACLPSLWVSAHFASTQVAMTAARAERVRRSQYVYNLLVSEQAAKEVRSFLLRDFFVGRLRILLREVYEQDRSLALRQLAAALLAGGMLVGAQASLIAMAGLEAAHGHLSLGEFNRYMLAIVQLASLVPSLAFSVGSLHQANLYCARLFMFLRTENRVEVTQSNRTLPAAISGGGLILDHVSFSYPGMEREVLHDVSFRCQPGEIVGVVGANGSGKSTLVRIIAGLYLPTAGRVVLDGEDTRTMDREVLRGKLSIAFQDFVVYNLSVRENVGLGQVELLNDGGAIASAARQSGLDRIVHGLPDGFDTVLGRTWERGCELSGGQRQLVALARALVREASVLVLDEPSSGLDAQTEAEFADRLLADRMGRPNRCVIIISHRMAVVQGADRIVVLKEGHLAEEGRHEDLLAIPGVYADMCRSQWVDSGRLGAPSTR